MSDSDKIVILNVDDLESQRYVKTRDLHAAGLVDRYTLLIHPLTLGSGTRLFEAGGPLTEFELTGSVTTTKGVIIARYAPGATKPAS